MHTLWHKVEIFWESHKKINKILIILTLVSMDYGRPVRKSTSLHGRKSTPSPQFLGMAEAYFVSHIGPNFQISLIYAFIGCPQSMITTITTYYCTVY